MANRSHLIAVAERYSRQNILRGIPELEVESSSINSKTCSIAFSTNHCGIGIKFPTELLEEIHMSGEMEESQYLLEEPDELEEPEEDDEEPVAESKSKKSLKKKVKR